MDTGKEGMRVGSIGDEYWRNGGLCFEEYMVVGKWLWGRDGHEKVGMRFWSIRGRGGQERGSGKREYGYGVSGRDMGVWWAMRRGVHGSR